MRTLSQFLVSCAISYPSFAGNLVEYTYGDSIAVGYGGKNPGSRRVGASPAEVLSYLERDLKDNPDKFKGKTVNISTGVSNNPGDFSSIESQLKLLKRSGAIVNVYGAARERYGKENERLGSLSSTYGANFKGGFKAGRDGVHPASYGSYDSTPSTPRTPSTPSTPAKLETPKTLAPVSSVLSKLNGVEGTGSGSNFVAKKWSDPERSRYKSYGGN